MYKKILQVTNNSDINLQKAGKLSITSFFASISEVNSFVILINVTKTDPKAVISQSLLYHFGVIFNVPFEFPEEVLLQAIHSTVPVYISMTYYEKIT